MPANERAGALRKLRAGIWGLAAILALFLGVALAIRMMPAGTSGQPQEDAIGAHFELVDRNGKIVTPETLKGTPYAIFFGFTRCPDVCPTTLSRMAHLRKLMGPAGDRFRILFVSVDTGHDKPADVGAYVDLFGTPMLGLTGNERQIKDAAHSFRVFYQKVPLGNGDYTIDHSAFVILMDRDGQFNSIISDKDSNEDALAALRALVS